MEPMSDGLDEIAHLFKVFEVFDQAKEAAMEEFKRRHDAWKDADQKVKDFIVQQAVNAGLNHVTGLAYRGEHDTHKLYVMYASGRMRPYKKGDLICLECGEVGVCSFNFTDKRKRSKKCWQCGKFPHRTGVIHKIGNKDVAVCKCGAHYYIED